MHKLSHRIALIAFAGTMVAGGQAFAAPPNGPSSQQPADFCAQNPTAPECLPGAGDNGQGRHKGGNTKGNRDHDNNGQGNNAQDNHGQGQGGDQGRGGGQPPAPGGTPPQNGNQPSHNGNHPSPPNGNQQPSQQGMNGPPPNGFHWSQRERDQFHRQFSGFNFGFFGTPGFSIHIGITVPHSYDLRPVPRALYRQYPQFRGYLFFTTRHGDVVIVSPKSHRIVAIL